MEVVDEDGGRPIDPAAFVRLTESWADNAPTGLYSVDRYALQVTVEATSPALALSSAMWSWKDALRRAGLPEWDLVRAELLTPDELEHEIEAAERPAADDPAPHQRPPSLSNVVEDELLRRALHDGRTGLPGRGVFLDDVRRALVTRAAAAVHAVVVFGLDGLESFDGGLNPAGDDAVLVEMARRLAANVRGGDMVASVRVDELAVFLEVGTADELDALAERILGRLGAPVLLAGRPVEIRVSLGMATASAGIDAESLVLNAERAMRAAMDEGGSARMFQAVGEPGQRTSSDRREGRAGAAAPEPACCHLIPPGRRPSGGREVRHI